MLINWSNCSDMRRLHWLQKETKKEKREKKKKEASVYRHVAGVLYSYFFAKIHIKPSKQAGLIVRCVLGK